MKNAERPIFFSSMSVFVCKHQTQVQRPSLTHTNSNRGAGDFFFPQQAHWSHQVYGRAAWRMWLDKQLRWRLSKALDLRLCGLRGRERERARERLSQSICIKVMGQCVT